MKKIFFLIVFVVIGTITIIAQDLDQIQDQDRDQVRLMLVDGDVLQIRDQDQIRLQTKLTLNDGTEINPDGSYITQDRLRLRLRDGECMDMDGIKYRNEYQYRYKVEQENKGLTRAQILERNQNRVHFMFANGEIIKVRNQYQNKLQNQLKLDNGTTVNPDGKYETQARIQFQLKNGECLNMNGEKFKNTYQHRKMILKKNTMKNKVKKNLPIR